jgi:hypothetical protein
MRTVLLMLLAYAIGAVTMAYCRRGIPELTQALIACQRDRQNTLAVSVVTLQAVSKALPKVRQVSNKVMVVGD